MLLISAYCVRNGNMIDVIDERKYKIYFGNRFVG